MALLLKSARGRGKRASEQLVLMRCLLLLNRLKQGAASKRELIDAVQHELPEAYPASPAAQREALKQNLKHSKRKRQMLKPSRPRSPPSRCWSS